MKAVVFHGIGDIRLDRVAEPKLKDEWERSSRFRVFRASVVSEP